METAVPRMLEQHHKRSRGYDVDPPATLFPRIMVGPPGYLTPAFVHHCEITHVINCAEPGLTPRSILRQVKSYHMQTQDHIFYPILEQPYTHFEHVMTNFLRDPSCRCVYVHCAAGMNRSAALAHAYVVKQFRVPLMRLLENSMKQRPCMLQNPGFAYQLVQFAKKHA